MARRRDVLLEARRGDQEHGGFRPAGSTDPARSITSDPLTLDLGHRSPGEHAERALLQSRERVFEPDTRRFEAGRLGVPDRQRLADRQRDRAERLRNLRAVPAPGRPVAIRLDVKRQDRMPGRAGEPDGAGLRDARRAARAVDGERDRPPVRRGRAAAARARATPPRDVEPRAVPKPKRCDDAARSTRRRSSGW